MPSNELP
ncbi:hypothetical protein AYI69_g5147, partial [Smittium culicis]